MKQHNAGRTAELPRAVGKEHQSDGGRQRKTGPRRETAKIASAHQTDGKSDLAAGGSRQKLVQTYEIGVDLLVEPAAAHDELVAEISDLSDRSAEAGNAEPEKHQKDLDRRA